MFEGLIALGVEYQLARVLAACCEGVFLYCCMRWLVFRDGTGSTPVGSHRAAQARIRPADQAGRRTPAVPASVPPAEATHPAVQAETEGR